MATKQQGSKPANGKFGGMLIVVTVTADQFASFVTFECPCDRSLNQFYALTYLIGPSVILFFIALLKQQRFWHLVTGACRSESAFGGHGTHFAQGALHWLTVVCIALPAAVVWFLIQMLKGTLYSCAFWPDGPCDGETNYTEPCNAPKTIDVPLNTCDHRINRDLHAESHAIAWMGIVGCGIIILFVFIMQRAFSKHSYLQTMWIREYRKAEADAFKRKIKLRANDLACELVNEFLVEERACDEWNGVSKIGLPQTDPNDPGKVLLSPLATWADQKADELFANKPGKSAKDQSAFYFLEPDEMTFNKERNPDPPITEHHVKIFHVNE